MADEAMYRKESIVSNAIDVISESGLQAISTKEIAKRSGISEGTLFRHFPRKNILLQAVLEHYCQYDDDIFHTAMMKNVSPRDALLFYIEFYAAYYENYPEITVIMQSYDLINSIPEIREDIGKIFGRRQEFMRQLIEKVKESGEIKKEADSELLTDIFSSSLRGICLVWRMKSFGFPLKKRLMNTAYMLLDAFGTSEKV